LAGFVTGKMLHEREGAGAGPHDDLKINYRNTRQILQTASAMAIALLRPQANTAGYRPLC